MCGGKVVFYYYLLLSFLFLNLITDKSLFQSKFYTNILLICMAILTVIISVVNPITADMRRYLSHLNIVENIGLFDAIAQSRWEPGFVTFQWLLSKISTSYVFFISITTLLIVLIIISALKRIVPYDKIPLIIFGYLSLFSFYSLINNVLRQEFSVAFLLIMLICLKKNKYMLAVTFLIIAVSFHMTAIIGAILIISHKMNFSFNTHIYIFFVTALTMLFNINQQIVSLLPFSLVDDAGNYIQQYTSDSSLLRYGEVNRLDFLLFSVFWFVFGLFFYKKYMRGDLFYELIIKAYAIYGSMFFLFGFISFSDRLAAYSWFLIPLLLFYPIIKMKTNYKLVWLFMGLIICIIMLYAFDASDYFTFLMNSWKVPKSL